MLEEFPESITVGCNDYEIIWTDKLVEGGNLAITDFQHCTIRISYQCLDIKWQILLHEILHIIDHVYNANKLDEDTIERLSHGLLQVIKQLDERGE